VATVMNLGLSTKDHQLKLDYEFFDHYSVLCSCGWTGAHRIFSAQNLSLSEILAWMSYKHAGQSGVYSWSS
jgi:hypothetical protein